MQNGQTESNGLGWKDNVGWLISVIDFCGLTVALVSGGRNTEKLFRESDGFEGIPLTRKVNCGKANVRDFTSEGFESRVSSVYLRCSSPKIKKNQPNPWSSRKSGADGY